MSDAREDRRVLQPEPLKEGVCFSETHLCLPLQDLSRGLVGGDALEQELLACVGT